MFRKRKNILPSFLAYNKVTMEACPVYILDNIFSDKNVFPPIFSDRFFFITFCH